MISTWSFCQVSTVGVEWGEGQTSKTHQVRAVTCMHLDFSTRVDSSSSFFVPPPSSPPTTALTARTSSASPEISLVGPSEVSLRASEFFFVIYLVEKVCHSSLLVLPSLLTSLTSLFRRISRLGHVTDIDLDSVIDELLEGESVLSVLLTNLRV